MRRDFGSLLITFLTVFTGCNATPTAEPAKVLFPAAAAPGFEDGFDARSLTIHKGDLSGTASFDAMIDDLRDADVILVGEIHSHPTGLDFIATTFEALAQQNDRLILSMEFYERDEQVALDDYIHGVTTYPQFASASGRTGSNNPIGHLRMVKVCKEKGRAVVAANSPRRYSTLARKEGFDALRALTADQQALYEIPDALPVGYYADLFRETMSGMVGHNDNDDVIEGFLRAQSVWDHTMAASVTDAVLSDNASVYHVVGHFHVDQNLEPGGSQMSDVIRKRLGPSAKIRSLVVHGGETEKILDEDLPNEKKSAAANYIVYVPYADS